MSSSTVCEPNDLVTPRSEITPSAVGGPVGGAVGGDDGSAGAFAVLVSSAMVPFPTGPAGAGHGVPFPVTEVTVTGLQIV